MPTRKKRLTQKLVDDMLGTTGVADYLHNVLHALARQPPSRVARALASADIVSLLVRTLQENRGDEEDVKQVVSTWCRTWRAPTRPVAARVDAVGANLEVLTRLLGLEPLERDIVRLALELRLEPLLSDLFRQLGTLGLTRRGGAVAAFLGVSREAASKALLPAGRLGRLGLISPDQQDQELELAGHVLLVLDEPRRLDEDEVRDLLLSSPGRPASLSAEDFGHVADSDLALEVLRRAIASGKPGVNVLLYGAPGTGKTEFARVLAAGAGAQLVELPPADEPKDVARQRLARLRTTLQLVPPRRSVVLFDELEDLFERVGFWLFSSMKPHMSKQAFNELLETNPVPVVWTTNSVDGMDPAFLRRFTCAVPFRELGAAQRAKVLERHLGPEAGLVAADVRAIAQRYSASPAQLNLAVETTRMLGEGKVTRAALERVLAPSERLVTGQDPRTRAVFDPAGFRESVLNASMPVAELVAATRRWEPSMGALAMCFSGPPGTGKTELAQYLASVRDRPVLRKTAADILDKYVGGTEQRLAEAFEAAQEDGAVLLFDEVDSLLRDRRGAQQSWEVTQVNEFLQRLETYRGVVICTTNLVEDLDPAAMRRFPFKVQFGWLRTEQAVELFKATLGRFVPGASDEELHAALRGLDRLAPGDFAALARRAQWLEREWTVDALARELAREVDSRGAVPRLGFAR